MARKVSAAAFARFLGERRAAGDGYIMGATGQNPRKWSANSWWFTQYSGAQKAQALKWRAQCARVWDCNGLFEGYYKDVTGVDINTRARYNYSGWCGVKGKGAIPAKHRVPGAAVFSGNPISHVGFLERPVDPKRPEGDWHVIEARGVMYGVVRTRLSGRNWTRWGLMTKYADYEAQAPETPQTPDEALGTRSLRMGDVGADVEGLQEALLRLGYQLPHYGADGEFGAETRAALVAFQADNALPADGVCDADDVDKLRALGAATGGRIAVTGGSVNIRERADAASRSLGVVRAGALLERTGDDAVNWFGVLHKGAAAFISRKYSEVAE